MQYDIGSSDDASPSGNSSAPKTKASCVQAIALDPQDSGAWSALGGLLTQDGDGECMLASTADISGITYTSKDCYSRALGLNPLLADAWLILSCILSEEGDGSTVDIIFTGDNSEAGTSSDTASKEGSHKATLTSMQCVVCALEVPNHNLPSAWAVSAWAVLASELSSYTDGTVGHRSSSGSGSGVAVVSGAVYTPRQCYIMALRLDETLCDAWYALGNVLDYRLLFAPDLSEDDANTVTINYVTFVLQEAVDIRVDGDGDDGPILSSSTTSYNRIQCYLRVLDIDETRFCFW